MIDRGDLSIETSVEGMVLYQKTICARARSKGKPVIIATEMLQSMVTHASPTKAEVADIANAVLDGCSATMLSAETAVGQFPVESVRMMKRIADTAFTNLRESLQTPMEPRGDLSPSQAVEDAIALILRSLPVTKVVAITRGGYTARMLSARSVTQPILAVTDDPAMARIFNMYAGVEGYCVDVPFEQGSSDHVKSCVSMLYKDGLLDRNDVILVTGLIYPTSGTRMNFIQLHAMSDLVKLFALDD